MTGLDAPIKSFLESYPDVIELKQQIQGFVERWLPLLEKTTAVTLRLRLVAPVVSIAQSTLLNKLVSTSNSLGTKSKSVTPR
ncbi:hypothetical protein JCM19239_1774 [Vibrio variabilis]|uniref:Uncharacterized protein n=1 Tax=Vibrio variabilis TaxID=990271 RepID=A0ABQ0JLZ3_9VIBR|nr:hypothetical protein JCM19239_1774 [Vibrio variabilis]